VAAREWICEALHANLMPNADLARLRVSSDHMADTRRSANSARRRWQTSSGAGLSDAGAGTDEAGEVLAGETGCAGDDQPVAASSA